LKLKNPDYLAIKRDYFEKALKVQNHPEAHNELGKMYYSQLVYQDQSKEKLLAF